MASDIAGELAAQRTALDEKSRQLSLAASLFYETIRQAKNQGLSYTDLQDATGLARSTLQDIIQNGENPKRWA